MKTDPHERSASVDRWRAARRGLGAVGILLLLVVAGFAVYYALQTARSRQSFYSHWQPGSAKATVSAEDIMTGSWTGAWKSLGMKDGGNIKCIIAPTNETAFHARFLSGHYGAFESEDMVVFSPSNNAGALMFEGSIDLGLEGIYTYKGRATGTNIFIDWKCALDYGNLTLWRMDDDRPTGDGKMAYSSAP